MLLLLAIPKSSLIFKGNFYYTISFTLATSTVYISNYSCSEGEEWKELRSTMNPVFVPRKLGRHVHKLNAVHDTFVRLAQEGADTDGYSKDLMELLPYWSMEGEDV